MKAPCADCSEHWFVTQISYMIQENRSIPKSHLTIHMEILEREQRAKPADENITEL